LDQNLNCTRCNDYSTQLTNSNLVIHQQHSSPVIQQPLYTTVQPQQKINILQQSPQPQQQALIGSTASLLSQQHQQQKQARTQFSITSIRPIVASLSPSPNTSFLSGQQHHQVQPVTQMIIQPSDSLLQRSFLSSTNSTIPQPQIITVNHQPIKTEILHAHSSPLTTISSIQQKTILKSEDDLSDDHNNIRHMTHDDRLIPAMILRRRFHELVDKDKRLAGMAMTDDAAFGVISNAAKDRLKYLIEQVKLIAQHRIDISMKNDPAYQQTSDVKGQIRFLEDLDKIEKQKKR